MDKTIYMSDIQKAAQMALEALEDMDSDDPELNQEWLGKKAIDALRAALAQPEPAGAEDMKVYAAIADGYNKRQRQPLTEQEISEFGNGLNGIHPPISRQRRDLLLVRVAEAAHGIE